MLLHIDTLIEMTRMAMGRNARSHPAIDCRDDAAVSLDRRIAAALPAVARQVVAHADVTALADVAIDISDTAVYWDASHDGYHTGHIVLPADYMRLVCFRMADWQRAVHTAHGADSAMAAMMSGSNAAIAGVPERPAACVRVAPEGLLLHFGACRSADTAIAEATYAAEPRVSRDGYISIPRSSLDAVISQTAMTLK